jgi:hypothetical protein
MICLSDSAIRYKNTMPVNEAGRGEALVRFVIQDLAGAK